MVKIETMKKIAILLVLIVCVSSCSEEQPHSPTLSDDVSPSIVSGVELNSINGGFDITYDLPDDQDLLYVKAVYTASNGEEAEVKSSSFSNSIQILGFGDTEEKVIKLYAADRSENLSEVVEVKGNPLTPPVFLIQETMKISPDFGGAKYSWSNELNVPVAIEFLTKEASSIEIADIRYTEQTEGESSLRGYEPQPRFFAAVIRDRYDNYSDTIYADTPDRLLTPLLEERLDKTLFKKVEFDNDDDWNRWGGNFSDLYDDNSSEDSFAHTQGDGPLPNILSIDLGKVVTLSRFNVLQRGTEVNRHWAFSHGNPKRYTVYGSIDLPPIEGDLSDWTLLRECEAIKPSGLPIGQTSDEDFSHFDTGDEFNFGEATEVRYIRLVVHQTWDGAGFVNLAELTFWGN
ncbi:MAG: hypothetical protein ACI9P5_001987 [Saprospiraceae bacterium]|jgi:hypothetical protein